MFETTKRPKINTNENIRRKQMPFLKDLLRVKIFNGKNPKGKIH